MNREKEKFPFILVERSELLPINITEIEEKEIRSIEGIKDLEELENELYDTAYVLYEQYNFSTDKSVKEEIKKE